MLKLKTTIKNMKIKKAFTLIEILIVVFLGTIIITAAYSVYLISYKSYKKNSANAELTQNARIALERVSRDIRQAMEIVTELPLTPSEGTPPSEIKFQEGHDFLTTGKPQYITYSLSGTDLHRKVSHYYFSTYPNEWVLYSIQDGEGNFPEEQTDLEQIKAQKISSLQFWGDETITIRLDVSDGESTFTFETKTLGRNI